MSLAMTKLTILTGLVGLLVGFVLSAYAHSGNGFETAPVVVLGMIIATLGAAASGVLIFIIGRRGNLVSGMGIFSAAMLFALVLVPIVWPYPKAPGPLPLNEQDRKAEPK